MASKGKHTDEFKTLKAAKRQVDIKLQLLRERYKEDISLFNEARVENILKNSGAREYLERLKDRTKVKDDVINNLKEELEFKNKEIAELEDRCKRIESAKEDYLRYWKEAQAARERLEAEMRSDQSSKEQRRSVNRHHNMSATSSLIDNQVPPPPPIDVPSIDEILRSASSTLDMNNPYNSLDSSIPPPPPIDVPLDELLQGSGSGAFKQEYGSEVAKQEHGRRAFEQERGQFLCHVYASVNVDSSTEVLGNIIELVDAEQRRAPNNTFRDWKAINCNSEPAGDNSHSQFHVTLIRGHRVIYHHQIGPLLDSLESEIKSFEVFLLCLDKLKLFYNHEQTKQFLCIATRDTKLAKEVVDLTQLKLRLRNIMDQFATRMTEEDESDDTLAHCSLMFRDVQQVYKPNDVTNDLEEIERLCIENSVDYPICLVQVDAIHIRIGNRIYSFNLSKKLN